MDKKEYAEHLLYLRRHDRIFGKWERLANMLAICIEARTEALKKKKKANA